MAVSVVDKQGELSASWEWGLAIALDYDGVPWVLVQKNGFAIVVGLQSELLQTPGS